MHTKTDNTHESEKKTWLDIKKIAGEKSVEVSIDLTPYINAYKAYKNYQEGPIRARRAEAVLYGVYYQIRQELVNEVTGDDWGLWDSLVDVATDAERLSMADPLTDEDRETIEENRAIQESAAHAFMQDAYIEILKNSMDEAILSHFESGDPYKPAIVKLRVCIDNTTNPNEISIICTDNGRGFPPDLLEKFENPETRQAYADERGSSKSDSKVRDDLPLLFGGQGRGLRILIAKIERGDDLQPNGRRMHNWELTEKSEITLSNEHPGSGAVTKITTSKMRIEPAKMAEQNQRNIKKTVELMRDISPISIDTDLSGGEEKEDGGSDSLSMP